MADVQHEPDQDLAGVPAVEMLRDILGSAYTCMLVTQHDRFPFHARPMGAQGVDTDGAVWFLSASDSQKNADIERDPRVTLLALRPGSGQYWTTKNGEIVTAVRMLLSAAGADVGEGGVHGQLRI